MQSISLTDMHAIPNFRKLFSAKTEQMARDIEYHGFSITLSVDEHYELPYDYNKFVRVRFAYYDTHYEARACLNGLQLQFLEEAFNSLMQSTFIGFMADPEIIAFLEKKALTRELQKQLLNQPDNPRRKM